MVRMSALAIIGSCHPAYSRFSRTHFAREMRECRLGHSACSIALACASCSFERLILPEVGDCQAQRVDRNQLIRDMAFEDEHEVGGVEVALQFAVIGWYVVHHVEIDPR